MTKSLKGLSGRVNSIATTEEFISGRHAATLIQPVATLGDGGNGFLNAFDWSPTNSRIPTWTIKEAPEFCPCPVCQSGAKAYGLAHGNFTNDTNDAPVHDLTIPTTIMDEGVVALTVPGSVSGVIDFDGDSDDITVDLIAGTTYLISLRGTGATPVGDTFLELLDATGTVEIYHDDDGGNGTYSLMTITAAATGTYIIRAGTFPNPGDPDVGGYTVDVLVQGVDSVGDTNATSVALSQGTTFGFRETGATNLGADLDRYAVTLEAGKFYTFKVAGGSDYESGYYEPNTSSFGEMDTFIRLRNSGGTLLASNDDVSFPNDLSSALGFFATTTGTYYLDITGYAGSSGGYVIDFEEVDLSLLDPLDAIRWFSADNIDTVDVAGTPTAYVYFGTAGQDFGEGLTTLGWNATEKAAVMQALLEYTKITGIQYAETADINQAEFRLNTVASGSFGAYFYPQDPAYGTQQGIGIFNRGSGGWNFEPSPGVQPALQQGGFAFAVILHEFGHAHGLAHPHDNGGGSDVMAGVTAAQGSLGVFNLNQGVYTVMSYNDAWWLHPDGHFGGPVDPTRVGTLTTANIDNGWSATLSAFDIAVLQERYGVHDFNVADTVYALSDVTNAANYQCIWDTGGIDTISYGGALQATIDLTAATLDYSATGGGAISFVIDPATIGIPAPTSTLRGGYTIANDVIIENATGGGGNDTLIGNAAANVLTGNFGNDTMVGRAGDDTLNGGVGTDTARYFGARADYTIHAVIINGAITGFTVTDDNTANGNDGTDTLNGMETAQFDDASIALVGAVAVFDGDGDLVSVHTTIQAAIDAGTTLAGYTIFVSRGAYFEDVNVTKDVTIQGANNGVAGDDARGLETEVRSFTITASGVTVDGVKVFGQIAHPNAPLLPAGVYVIGNDFSLVNSLLDGPATASYGILTQAVTGLDVGNNLVTGYPAGIYVSGGSSTGSIHDNVFQGDGPGSGTGTQNGVLSESNVLLIQANTFDGIDGGSIYALPQGPTDTLDLLDIIIGNTITNSGAVRPIQIYPSTGTPNVLGTDENEAFVGDWGGLAGVNLSFVGRGGDDHIYGDTGNDDFEGNAGLDQLYGGGGSDLLNGGADNDLLDGGAGVDTAVFADSALTYTDTAVGWLITSSEGNDFVQNTEIVTANGQRNLLVGSTGFATIQDAFDNAENNDFVRLAAGTHSGTWNYSNSGLIVLAQPGAQINGSFLPTGTDGITVVGANLADNITTGAGNDVISGGGGADTMAGGAGDDRYIVDNAGDVVNEATGEGNDIVTAQVSYALAAGSEVELMTTGSIAGTGAIDLTGNELDNQLWGNNGVNTLSGGNGADILIGFGGDDQLIGGFGGDTMLGGLGNDTYYVDNVGDSLYENVGEGADQVVALIDYTLTAGSEIELLTTGGVGNINDINLTGNEFGNQIWGNNGANVIDGGDGTDVLLGFGGADTFKFSTALGAGNVDAIVDYSVADDSIQLDSAVFTELGGAGPLSASAFVVGTAALDADDRIIYDSTTGNLFYDADGVGGAAAVQFAVVIGQPALTASEFTVI